MRCELQIRLTDTDYADFNIFHMNRSPYSKSLRKGTRWPVAAVLLLCAALTLLAEGLTVFSVTYAAVIALVGGVMLWKFDSLFAFVFRRMMKRMKKSGKMGYSPESTVIFTEEGILEITPEAKTERQWSSVERLCLVEGKVWYLYLNNTAAFILPVEQLDAQADIGELYRFLEGKCPAVDRFEK